MAYNLLLNYPTILSYQKKRLGGSWLFLNRSRLSFTSRSSTFRHACCIWSNFASSTTIYGREQLIDICIETITIDNHRSFSNFKVWVKRNCRISDSTLHYSPTFITTINYLSLVSLPVKASTSYITSAKVIIVETMAIGVSSVWSESLNICETLVSGLVWGERQTR